MKLIIVDNKEDGGVEGFKVFKDALDSGAKTFGLATGSTPVSTYDQITASDLDFSNSISINLDEYVNIKPDNPQSYHAFMNEHLFSSKPFKKSYLLDGLAPDTYTEVTNYDKVIKDNPIDLQLLGLGRNGHIGFNEPNTPFSTTTHKVKLTPSTITANKRFFDNEDDVPKYAYSMGIKSIMQSKKILVIAYGAEKAEAINNMINGPITEKVPASVLQLHPNVTVIVDKNAASKLN